MSLNPADNEGFSVVPFETAPHNPFDPIAIDDVIISQEPAWAIQRLLPARGLAAIIGPPKCGKSFLTSDALFALARGQSYAGRETLPGGGPVFYCTGEGVTGFKRRLVAMRRHYGVEGQGVPFFMVPNVPDLGSEKLSNTDLQKLLDTLDRFIERRRLPAPRAVVLDTVARCMGDGDENTARDMTRFVNRCGTIERRYSCLMAVVHHTGKDETRGGRGSNALNGAADVTWQVEKTEHVNRVSITEMKDGPEGTNWTFRLLPYDLKTGDRNLPETYTAGFEDITCVVEVVDKPSQVKPAGSKRNKPVLGVAGDLLKVIKEAIVGLGTAQTGSVSVPGNTKAVSNENLKKYCATMAWQDPYGRPDSFRSMLSKNKSNLRSRGLIGFNSEWTWTTGEG